MLIAMILEKQPDSKISKFEDSLKQVGYENIKMSDSTVCIGPQKHQIRCVIKNNAKKLDKVITKIITDDPAVIRIVNELFDVENVNVR